MAWEHFLLDASFRGVSFHVLRTEDGADRSTAEHAYPYVDGADIEDLGRGPRRLHAEAIVWGPAYEETLRGLIEALDASGPGELVHPVFGSIPSAQVVRYSVRHEAEGVDQATVSMEWVESTPAAPFFSRSLPGQQAQAIPARSAAARSAVAGAIESVVGALRASNALAALDGLRAAMLQPLSVALAQVQGALTSGLDVISYPRAWANDLSAVVDGIVDLRDYGGDVAADWRAAGAALDLLDVFRGAPAADGPGYVPVGSADAVTPPLPGVVPTERQAASSAAVAVEVAVATARAYAASQVLQAEAAAPTLSPPEIEAVANTARADLARAIAAAQAALPLEPARAVAEPLRDAALAVQDAARAIIEARPPLVVRTLEAPGNLRLLAHRWYGDHARAAELWRLNLGALQAPNRLGAGDRIHAYAR